MTIQEARDLLHTTWREIGEHSGLDGSTVCSLKNLQLHERPDIAQGLEVIAKKRAVEAAQFGVGMGNHEPEVWLETHRPYWTLVSNVFDEDPSGLEPEYKRARAIGMIAWPLADMLPAGVAKYRLKKEV
jgi:hypothetical protein